MTPPDQDLEPQRSPMPHDLANRWAVVTGAARGIGLAIARRLQEAGAIVLAVDSDGDTLEREAKVKEGYWPIQHDLGSADIVGKDGVVTSGHELAAKILGRIRKLQKDQPDNFPKHLGAVPTLMVNNVGVSSEQGFLDLDPGTYDELHRINVRTPWFLTKTLVRALLEEKPRRPASILFISSVHDRVVSYRPAYGTAKAAITQLTKELAYDLGRNGIRVNSISPGWIRTDPDPTSDQQRDKWRRLTPIIPLGCAGDPDDVARLAVRTLSDYWSGYVNGTDLVLDGGLSQHTWMRPPGADTDPVR